MRVVLVPCGKKEVCKNCILHVYMLIKQDEGSTFTQVYFYFVMMVKNPRHKLEIFHFPLTCGSDHTHSKEK